MKMQSSKFKLLHFLFFARRPSLVSRPSSLVPRPSSLVLHPSSLVFRPLSKGFTYIALLAAIVILGISLGAAGKYWSHVILREKEEELLFRGNQYVLAIERYSKAVPGLQNRAPASIDNLFSDTSKRYLRQRYKDPITGGDFVEIFSTTAGQTRQLIGVHSSSDKEPLKQSNFPDKYKDFEGKKKYSDWKFVYVPQQTVPGGLGIGIMPGIKPGTGAGTGK